MNKLFTASAAALLLTSGAAMAATNDVTFFGNVSEITCDVQVVVGGKVNNMVQLGTVKKNTAGTEVNFSLEPKDKDACTSSLTGGGHDSTVTWAGNLNSKGVAAQKGLASDAYVKLTAVNSTHTNTAITSGADSVEFADGTITDTGGLKFTAALQGGTEIGDFQSAASYVITYK